MVAKYAQKAAMPGRHGYIPRVVPMILLQMPFEAWVNVPMILLQMPFEAWVNVPYILLAMCFTAWVVPYNSVSKMLYSMGSPLQFC